jgi:uncharacterized C2H2 Zn-finger protein
MPKRDRECDEPAAADVIDGDECGENDGDEYDGDERDESKPAVALAVVGPPTCGICKKTFTRRWTLTKHIATIHGGIKTHKCLDCGAAFGEAGALTRHKTSVHKGVKPHGCPHCDMTFARGDALHCHVAAVHVGLRPYGCKECDAAFAHASDLRRHVECVHEGLKPFDCPECEASFGLAASLRSHIKTVHEGLKDNVCPDCGAAFSQVTGLNYHIARVHQGLRPHTCTECDAAFFEPGRLRDHIQNWHSPDAVIIRKKDERRVHQALEIAGFTYSPGGGDATPLPMHFKREHHVTFACMGSTFARIDFVVTLANGSVVLLEVDERQHRFGYDVGCDMRRMGRIVESLRVGGFMGGIRFVRYNCDACRVAGTLVKVPKKHREAALMGILHVWGTGDPFDNETVRISYCYYDREFTDSPKPIVVDDPDYHPAYAEVAESLL